MSALIIESVYADSVAGDVADRQAREAAVLLIVESVRRITDVPRIRVFGYVENADPAFGPRREQRITTEAPQDIDALGSESVRLTVRETSAASFAIRCSLAIRPACHRGTIMLDDRSVELSYDACDPTSITWTLPEGIQIKPEAHTAILRHVVDDLGIDVLFQ